MHIHKTPEDEQGTTPLEAIQFLSDILVGKLSTTSRCRHKGFPAMSAKSSASLNRALSTTLKIRTCSLAHGKQGPKNAKQILLNGPSR